MAADGRTRAGLRAHFAYFPHFNAPRSCGLFDQVAVCLQFPDPIACLCLAACLLTWRCPFSARVSLPSARLLRRLPTASQANKTIVSSGSCYVSAMAVHRNRQAFAGQPAAAAFWACALGRAQHGWRSGAGEVARGAQQPSTRRPARPAAAWPVPAARRSTRKRELAANACQTAGGAGAKIYGLRFSKLGDRRPCVLLQSSSRTMWGQSSIGP